MGAYLLVESAREHNLKNVTVSIPRKALTVVTGISGSGKSSLVFDTIYAEGQRRFFETFSAYVRHFLGEMKRPNVDRIEGLSPVIAIDQKTISTNPRSTVGTITEIYDLLRLLYARVSKPYSYETGKPLQKFSLEELVKYLIKRFHGEPIAIMAPIVRRRKGVYQKELEQALSKGYSLAYIDGKMVELRPGIRLNRYQIHEIDIVIDRLKAVEANQNRIQQAIELAFSYTRSTIVRIYDYASQKPFWFSTDYIEPETGISYGVPEPNTFSFNSHYGWCEACKGLGIRNEVNMDGLINWKAPTITNGGLILASYSRQPFRYTELYAHIKHLFEEYGFSLSTPLKKLPDSFLNLLIYGEEGIKGYLERALTESGSDLRTDFLKEAYSILESNTREVPCPSCDGYRINPVARNYKLAGKHIGEVAMMPLSQLPEWMEQMRSELKGHEELIASEIIKELSERLHFLLEIGLGYLHLHRPAKSLSGGESQRVRLATQLGSRLTEVLYILDEPSIGLHPRDNAQLIASLKRLRDLGNTVIIVEHDEETMLNADYLIDIGPKAGREGGTIVNQGDPETFLKQGGITAEYLRGEKQIPIPKERKKPNWERCLTLSGAHGNNLKWVTAKFPLGLFICVTGVSGSGKSSLIHQTLYPILHQHVYHHHLPCLPYESVSGLEWIDKVILIDQEPIGRTPRSNPATYTKVFDLIRKLYASVPESKKRGYTPGRFSFNVKGGRCERCKGSGVETIQMEFLPEVYVECPECRGRRYNQETLNVRFQGKSIYDVLEMTVEEALPLFSFHKQIKRYLQALYDVGLGYLKLGQPSPTLSGGEAQRVKIASELCKIATGNTVYILDEPTTGLHFQDVEILIQVLRKLTDKGNTVIVIEHHLDVIKCADWIIDLGPEGGEKGGEIVATGTPEEIAQNPRSITGQFLAQKLIPKPTFSS